MRERIIGERTRTINFGYTKQKGWRQMGCNGTTALFAISGSEIREMMTAKIEANAATIAAIELAASAAPEDVAIYLKGRLAGLTAENDELSFARLHVGTGPFEVTGQHLAQLRCDMKVNDMHVASIVTEFEEIKKYRQREGMLAAPTLGQLSDCQPMRISRW